MAYELRSWGRPALLAALAWCALAALGVGAIAFERPTARAEGRVTTADGKAPLAHARVTFAGAVTRTVETDADGRFSAPRLPVGEYSVSARARHYDLQWLEGSLTLKEGEAKTDLAFGLSPTVPALEVANVQRVFPPGRALRLPLRGTLVPELDVTIAEAHPEALRTTEDFAAFRRGERAGAARERFTYRVARERLDDDGWFYAPVALPSLPPGDYVATFDGRVDPAAPGAKGSSRLLRRYWFSVSDTALVTKRDRSGVLAYVTRFSRREAVPGARVRVLTKRGVAATAVTGPDGLARLPVDAPAESAVVTASAPGGGAIAETWGPPAREAAAVYAFTERPVYRPGQTVHFKAIVRRPSEAGPALAPASGEEARLTVRDPEGETVLARSLRLDADGELDFDFAVAEGAALGEYAYALEAASGARYAGFKVDAYKKPEVRLAVEPGRPRYALGETAAVRVSASYFFGGPAPGLKGMLTVYKAPAFGGFDDPEAAFFGARAERPFEAGPWGYGEVALQQEVTLDGEGQATVAVPMPREAASDERDAPLDTRFTASFEALDDAKRPVQASAAWLATQGDYRLEAEATTPIQEPGRPLTVRVTAADLARPGAPPAAGVALSATAWRLETRASKDADGNETSETLRHPAGAASATTDRNGLATLSVSPEAPGAYAFEIRARDGAGREIRTDAWAWVAEAAGAQDEAAPGSVRYGAVTIVFDKRVYRPGETARALVQSPVGAGPALVTLEGRRLEQARVVRLGAGGSVLEFPVTDALRPNVWLSVAQVAGAELLSAERSLNVSPTPGFLDVAVAADPPEAKPGETVRYTITTKDAASGRPVSASVSLGVVDAAVYAIAPDDTPDIRASFRGPRESMVSTQHSFAEDYSGGPDKFMSPARERARFEDVAAWFPKVRTGPGGTATVRVTLPDNLTTWVATARGATADTRVGEARAELVSRQDFLARLELPRFAREGDTAVVRAIVHNDTKGAERVRVRLGAEGAGLEGPERFLDIGAGARETARFTVRFPAPGRASFALEAAGAHAADAVRQAIPVRFAGLPVARAESLAAGRPSRALALPAGAGDPALSLRLGDPGLAAAAAAADYFRGYPYGCSEQTASKLLAATALAEALGAAAGAPVDPAPLVAKLASYQDPALGGWGWFDTDANPELSAHALWALGEARRAGAGVPDAALANGARYVRELLPTVGRDAFSRHVASPLAGPDLRAQLLHALASAARPLPAREVERLWRDRAGLSAEGLARFRLALARSGGSPLEGALADALSAKAEGAAGQRHWLPAAAPGGVLGWGATPERATGWALLALADAPGPLTQEARAWLAAQQRGGAWGATYETSVAALALARTAPADGAGAAEAVRVALAGFPEAPVAGPFFPAPRTVRFAPPAWTPEAGPLDLTLRASGALPPALAVLSYVDRPARFAAHGAEGFTLTKTVRRLSAAEAAEAAARGSWGDVGKLPRAGGEARLGDRLLVDLRLTASAPLAYASVVDPLPAGAEILDPGPPAEGLARFEGADDEARFHLVSVPKGETRLAYVLRPTVPGEFRGLPARAFLMYAPGAEATTEEARWRYAE